MSTNSLLFMAAIPVSPANRDVAKLFEALKQTNNSDVTYILIRDDHSFKSTRPELIKTNIEFLNTKCND